jgi:hypothetical protein
MLSRGACATSQYGKRDAGPKGGSGSVEQGPMLAIQARRRHCASKPQYYTATGRVCQYIIQNTIQYHLLCRTGIAGWTDTRFRRPTPSADSPRGTWRPPLRGPSFRACCPALRLCPCPAANLLPPNAAPPAFRCFPARSPIARLIACPQQGGRIAKRRRAAD